MTPTPTAWKLSLDRSGLAVPVATSLLALAFLVAPPLVSFADAKPASEKRADAKAGAPRDKAAASSRKAAAKPASARSGSAQTRTKTAAAKEPATTGSWKVETVMGRGDTLVEVLRRHGIDNKQAHTAVKAVADIYDPRRLDAGDRLTLMLERRADGPWLRALNLDPKAGQELTIQVAKDGTPAKPGKPESASVVVRRTEGTVNKGLREAMRAAKVPDAVVADALSAFRTDPDLPRKPPKNSRFIVVYEAESRRRGGVHNAALRFAALNVNGKVHPVYRYEMDDGDVVFVDKDGRGVAHIDLGSPIRNAKITSGFGWRVHPIYGETRFHKGVDYAAPTGTPVYAADAGVVEEIGWRGNYGQFIRIRHGGQVSTHYAHLSGFAAGLREGAKVRKGQLIGRVGETGAATGPHLDYGVMVHDEHVNPLSARPVVPVRLAGSDLQGFRSYVKRAGI